MGFLQSIFGGPENTFVNTMLALGIVLVLIVLGVWVLRAVTQPSGTIARGRAKRLALVETLAVDSRRKLLLVKRDDTEYLLLVGGTQDVLVETGMPAPAPQPVPARPAPATARQRPGRPSPAAPQTPVVAETQEPPVPPQAPRRPFAGQFRPAQKPVAEIAPRPQPQALPTDEEPPPLPSRNPLERLRDLGRSDPRRHSASLRHTGLLKAVSRLDPIPAGQPTDIEQRGATDSARTGSNAGRYRQGDDDWGIVGQTADTRDRDGN